MGWVKGSDRNFEASQTERYRKTKKDRRERRETSGGDPKIRVRGRGSSTSAPGSGPRIAVAKNLRGEGSRLSTGQAEGGPHAPEEAAPAPTVGVRFIVDGLVPIPEVTLSLVVGKEIQQAKKIPMNASGGGDYRRNESPAHIQCRVAGPILDNLLLGPVREHLIDVRMTQGPIQRLVGSVAMKVVNPGNINAQPTADAADHQVREVDVRAKLPVVHLDGWDAVGGLEVSITREGDEAILNEVVSPGLIAANTCVGMMCVSIIRATTGALPIVGDEGQHGRQRYPQE